MTSGVASIFKYLIGVRHSGRPEILHGVERTFLNCFRPVENEADVWAGHKPGPSATTTGPMLLLVSALSVG
jgi:hypothetical protein